MSQQASTGKYTVDIITLEEQPTLTIRFKVAPAQVAAKLAEVLPAVGMYTAEAGIQPSGQPFSRYHEVDADMLDIEAGMPVSGPATGKGEIQARTLPGGRIAMTWHVGPYDQLGSAHEALTQWVTDNNHTPAGAPWEVYVTDPGEEPDPGKWRTQVFLPLKD